MTGGEDVRALAWYRSVGADAHIGPFARVPVCRLFRPPLGVTPSGGLFFPLVRKEEEERHANGKGFLQSRPSLWNPILRGLFSRRALRCRARCLALLGPRNYSAAGNVGGRPAQRIGLWIRGNTPICHSERSEESCCKFALDSSSLALLRMTGGKNMRKDQPHCHSERSEESCCKFTPDSSSPSRLRMTDGAAGSAACDIPYCTALRGLSGARQRARASVWRADIASFGG